jgi:hypothetical protein
MDISRILLKDPDVMAPYDTPSQVVDHLRKSRVSSIQMIGRRGAVQSAFTIKEIREVSKIKGVRLFAMRDEFEASLTEESERETHADFSVHARGIKRRTEFIRDSCTFLDNENQLKEVIHGASIQQKAMILRYLLSPARLLGDDRI